MLIYLVNTFRCRDAAASTAPAPENNRNSAQNYYLTPRNAGCFPAPENNRNSAQNYYLTPRNCLGRVRDRHPGALIAIAQNEIRNAGNESRGIRRRADACSAAIGRDRGRPGDAALL